MKNKPISPLFAALVAVIFGMVGFLPARASAAGPANHHADTAAVSDSSWAHLAPQATGSACWISSTTSRSATSVCSIGANAGRHWTQVHCSNGIWVESAKTYSNITPETATCTWPFSRLSQVAQYDNGPIFLTKPAAGTVAHPQSAAGYWDLNCWGTSTYGDLFRTSCHWSALAQYPLYVKIHAACTYFIPWMGGFITRDSSQGQGFMPGDTFYVAKTCFYAGVIGVAHAPYITASRWYMSGTVGAPTGASTVRANPQPATVSNRTLEAALLRPATAGYSGLSCLGSWDVTHTAYDGNCSLARWSAALTVQLKITCFVPTPFGTLSWASTDSHRLQPGAQIVHFEAACTGAGTGATWSAHP